MENIKYFSVSLGSLGNALNLYHIGCRSNSHEIRVHRVSHETGDRGGGGGSEVPMLTLWGEDKGEV